LSGSYLLPDHIGKRRDGLDHFRRLAAPRKTTCRWRLYARALRNGLEQRRERLAPVARALRNGLEQRRVVVELRAQRLLELAVDLADAGLRDAEDLADLGQRHVLDVEQDGDLALTLGQA
jgi:uncharacterized protein YjiS (DUF1127 family)